MDIFVGVIVGLFVLMLLVTLHELGHFVAARRNGVRVLEFGIGFPPRAIAWVKDPKTKKWKRFKKKDWGKPQEGLIFSLNWLPIGGFCQMDGESAFDERKGTFGAASFWAKTKILFAGVAMNWLVAFLILTVLAWTGMPEFLPGQFSVESDTRVEESTEIVVVTTDDEGNEVRTPQKIRYSTWSAPIVGAGITLQITGQTFQGLGELLWNLISGVGRLFSFDASVRESGQEAISSVGESVSGPVGIVGVLFPTFTSAGPSNLAYLAAIISISLACMNVLPIPALDGGRWFLIGLYKLRRKKLTKEIEEKIVARAFVVLLALMLIVTVLDITRFF
ncbi:site-2 protease family protein [Candidatus Saccharibacteria bacterium]|nr:site-2 protease family protein [Candidatus Saccharibacteria bacterium]